MKNYNTLVLSGGGLKGFSILGALQYLVDEDKDHLLFLKKYYGVSVGAIICLLLIMQYQPKDILSEFIGNKCLSDVNINIYNINHWSNGVISTIICIGEVLTSTNNYWNNFLLKQGFYKLTYSKISVIY